MGSEKKVGIDSPISAAISLQNLVNCLASSSQSDMLRNNTVIVNEVAETLTIAAEEKKVIAVISELITTVVTNARNGHIVVTAQRFRESVILEIQDQNNYNGYALACRLKTPEPDATKIGGYLQIAGQQKLVTTKSFGFPIHPITN
jgi:hypothetical protein